MVLWGVVSLYSATNQKVVRRGSGAFPAVGFGSAGPAFEGILPPLDGAEAPLPSGRRRGGSGTSDPGACVRGILGIRVAGCGDAASGRVPGGPGARGRIFAFGTSPSLPLATAARATAARAATSTMRRSVSSPCSRRTFGCIRPTDHKGDLPSMSTLSDRAWMVASRPTPRPQKRAGARSQDTAEKERGGAPRRGRLAWVGTLGGPSDLSGRWPRRGQRRCCPSRRSAGRRHRRGRPRAPPTG